MCCKAGEEGGKRGSLGVMGVSERIGQEEGVRETWKVMEKEGILEKEGTVKKKWKGYCLSEQSSESYQENLIPSISK